MWYIMDVLNLIRWKIMFGGNIENNATNGLIRNKPMTYKGYK